MVDKIAAILVDSRLLTNLRVAHWLDGKADFAAIVVLISDPENPPADFPIIPAAIITNSERLSEAEFKIQAFDVLIRMSNLIPVVAVDDDAEQLQALEDSGVLVTLTSAEI